MASYRMRVAADWSSVLETIEELAEIMERSVHRLPYWLRRRCDLCLIEDRYFKILQDGPSGGVMHFTVEPSAELNAVMALIRAYAGENTDGHWRPSPPHPDPQRDPDQQ